MNTAEFMPFESVAPIMITNKEYPEYPFFAGTGFFAKFNPYDEIFFVTARHCTYDSNNQPIGRLDIPLEPVPTCKKRIIFSEELIGAVSEESGIEDVIIYVVDKGIPEQVELLGRRCLRLIHQDDASFVLNFSLGGTGKLRCVGFPSNSKEIDYKDMCATTQPRGLHGNVTQLYDDGLHFTMENLNWGEGELSGFSGSPMLELIPLNINFERQKRMEAVPVGVMVTGGNNIVRCVSINIVTDMIACYFRKQQKT